MSLRGLLKDSITLVKKDGSVFKQNVPASVQFEMIFINDVNLPIESEDHILRKLPSGLEEDFIVTNAHFFSAGSMSHWEVKYRRSGAPLGSAQAIVNYITGHNSRVNINSTDNSHNKIVDKSDTVFSDLIEVLQAKVNETAERDRLVALVEDMQSKTDGRSFKDKYQSFIAAAANHMAILAPFIPALTSYL